MSLKLITFDAVPYTGRRVPTEWRVLRIDSTVEGPPTCICTCPYEQWAINIVDSLTTTEPSYATVAIESEG